MEIGSRSHYALIGKRGALLQKWQMYQMSSLYSYIFQPQAEQFILCTIIWDLL